MIVLLIPLLFILFFFLRSKQYNFIPVLCIGTFMLLIIIYFRQAFIYAKAGVELWFFTVFPSLLPFAICVNLLIAFGIVQFLGVLLEPIMKPTFKIPGEGAFALVMGLMSGYPVGAKITAALRENGSINEIEAQRLIAFSNNSGPLFILGAVATGMFHTPHIGYYLLSIHYISALTVGLLFRYYMSIGTKKTAENTRVRQNKKIFKKAYQRLLEQQSNKPFGMLLNECVRDSLQLMLQIGGFIILFSVLMGVLDETHIFDFIARILSPSFSVIQLDSHLIIGTIKGMIEMTNGLKVIGSLELPIAQKIPISSFLIAWGGLSIQFQTISIMSHTDIKISIYLIAKFSQAIIAFLYALILFPIYQKLFHYSVTTFSPYYEGLSFSNYIAASLFSISNILIFLFIIGVLFHNIKKIVNSDIK